MFSVREAYYRARVQPCRRDAARLRDNIAYAILSVNVSTRETDKLFRVWKDAGRPDTYDGILDAWKDTPANFYHTKSIYLSGLMEKPDDWILQNARDRAALDTLPGLGFVKASFAAALNGARVACLDRHIIRSLRARAFNRIRALGVSLANTDQRLAPKSWKAYRALENVLMARHGAGCKGDLFVAQWKLWNQIRESVETHEILWSVPNTEQAPF